MQPLHGWIICLELRENLSGDPAHRPTTGQILGEMVPHNIRRFPAKLEVPIKRQSHYLINQYKLDYFLWVPNNIQWVFGWKSESIARNQDFT